MTLPFTPKRGLGLCHANGRAGEHVVQQAEETEEHHDDDHGPGNGIGDAPGFLWVSHGEGRSHW